MEQFYKDAYNIVKHRLDSAKNLVQEGTQKGEIYFNKYYMYAKVGGIVPDLLGDAKFVTSVLELIKPFDDPSEYQKTLDYYTQVSSELIAMEKDLKESELLNRKLTDIYKGADKAQIKSLVKKAWEKDHPGKVYAVAIIEDKWVREAYTGFKDNGGGQWFDYDNSWINVAVAVKKDDTTADVYVLEIGKSHKRGGQYIEDSFTATKYGSEKYLLKNIKQ